MSELRVPPAVEQTLTAEIVDELAEVFDEEFVYPARTVVSGPDDDEELFPGCAVPVLVISIENQGICVWGVPLEPEAADPPVLVGGELLGEPEPTTVEYAPNIAHFIAARRWDEACLGQQPLLQAQGRPIDSESLAFLRHRFVEVLPTTGWPANAQHRFEDGPVKVMVWSGGDQCDWWISGTDHVALAAVVKELLSLSDLRSTLWSNDPDGESLLADLVGP
jgi:hypothetical protein